MAVIYVRRKALRQQNIEIIITIITITNWKTGREIKHVTEK